MNGGFQHSIAGGNGNLVVTALQSPNFVSGVSGWQIDKNGNAEFNSIVLPPSAKGVQVTFAATAPASPNVDDLWYNTGSGNELSQWNGSAWVAYQYGTGAIGPGSITASLIAANTITASQLAAGIVYAGIVNGTTISGAQVVAYGTSGEILVYSGTPASGNLIGAWSGASGTDSHGNSYPQGLSVGAAGTGQVLLFDNGGQGVLSFVNTGFGNGSLFGGVSGTYAYVVLTGPGNTVTGHTDYAENALFSSDGVSSSASEEFIYWDANGSSHAYSLMNCGGFQIAAGSIAAVQPGTGTSSTNPANTETWHYVGTSGQPGFGSGWSNYGTGFASLAFRLLPTGNVEIRGKVAPGSANSTMFTLPTGYRPATEQQLPYAVTNLSTTTTAAWPQPAFNIQTNGNVTQNGNATPNAAGIWIAGEFSLTI